MIIYFAIVRVVMKRGWTVKISPFKYEADKMSQFIKSNSGYQYTTIHLNIPSLPYKHENQAGLLYMTLVLL